MLKESNPDELLHLQCSVTHLGDGGFFRVTTEEMGVGDKVRGWSFRNSTDRYRGRR